MAIAFYARKSIEKEGSISCETQLEYCKSMIKPDEKTEKIIEFVDNGFSGGNMNRDAFQKLMRKIERGQISKVIVYRLDRISRSLADFVKILYIFKENGVKFVSSQEAFDTSSPYGELVVKILAVFAEFERNSIIARVTQAYGHRSEMGFYMGGRLPYGYKLESTTINNIPTKKYIPKTDEVEQVKYIFETYAVENVTLNRLLKNLISKNIISLRDGDFTTAKLSTILKNPIYVCADNNVYDYFQGHNTDIISLPEKFDGVHGMQLYGRTKHDANNRDWSDIKAVVMSHEGIIDSETWIKCQKKLEKNKKIGKAVSNQTSWLGGKIVCEKCGRTMTTIKGKVKNNETRIYFNFTGKSHLKKCNGPNTTIYAQNLESLIYNEISIKLKELKVCNISNKNNISPRLNLLKNKLKTIEIEEQKIADTLINNEINSSLINILNVKSENLKNNKLEVISEIEELSNQEIDTKSAINFSKKWRNANFEEKRAVCNILINKIIVESSGNINIVWNI